MSLYRTLFLFFLIVPIIEIYLLLRIGSLIGALPTVILVVGTAVLGATMLKSQGLNTLRRLQDTLARQEIPAQEIVEGPLLLIGGALLLTPGFMTDAMGFYLLIPSTRKRVVNYLLANHFIIGGISSRANRRSAKSPHGTTIEGDYTRED
ncbi:MAG: FxsA family protein [Gammaproteobacteria bacterium]